jgi:hypothetical protein
MISVAKGYHVDDIACLESKDKSLSMSACLGQAPAMWTATGDIRRERSNAGDVSQPIRNNDDNQRIILAH